MPAEHQCSCGKEFTQLSQLSRHEKLCQVLEEKTEQVYKRVEKLGTRKRRRRQSNEDDDRARVAGPSRQGNMSGRKERRLEVSSMNTTSLPHDLNHGPPIICADSPDFDPGPDPATPIELDQREEILPPKRIRRPTARLLASLEDSEDVLPEGPGPLNREPALEPTTQQDEPAVTLAPRVFRTMANSFGLWREYVSKPPRIPDADIAPSRLVADNVGNLEPTRDDSPPEQKKRSLLDIIFPYPNMSAFRLNRWFWNGSYKKSQLERDKLLDDVILQPDFDPNDLRGVDFGKLDKIVAEDNDGVDRGNGWRTSTLTIRVPVPEKLTKATQRERTNQDRIAQRHDEVDPAEEPLRSKKFFVTGFKHRSLVHLMRTAIENSEQAWDFHWNPFKHFWQPPEPLAPPQRVFDEVYSSDAFIEADRKLQESPDPNNDFFPRVIAALMVWSDATHVAQFGQSKLWPIYVYFGNLSKYTRAKPTAHAGHQAGYLNSLPDNIQDFLKTFGQASGPILAHCRRELFHEAWKVMMDKDFMHAYAHGIVMKCADGITRRVFPRLFTYSADYPEKVLIATIRDMGGCPCQRCIIPKDQIPGLGTESDVEWRTQYARTDDAARRLKVQQARTLIYNEGYVVNSSKVDELLKAESYVPTENAFSERLSEDGFNFFILLVVDLMHEFELGMWKNLLTHLIRILHAEGEQKVQEFNERYPADVLDNITTAFGQHMRRFAEDTCSAFDTFETDKEHGARVRAETARHKKRGQNATGQGASMPAGTSGKRRKGYNLMTSKLHALGDYVQQIKLFGTTDSFTTQIGELQHRLIKAWNERSSKNNTVPQITSMDARERVHREMDESLASLQNTDKADPSTFSGDMAVGGSLGEPSTESMEVYEDNYRIAQDMSAQARIYLRDMLQDREKHDPAYMTYEKQLRTHLLARVLGHEDAGRRHEFEDNELNGIVFQHGCIYSHKTAAFNYTTYDIRRDQDTIKTHPNSSRSTVMVQSQDSENTSDHRHPYWYARVLGIHHAMVYHKHSQKPRRMDFLRVRWFGEEEEYDGGAQHLHLDRIGYVPESDEDAFGFLDPAQVLRACHLIPAFHWGMTANLLRAGSDARDLPQGDWVNYYVMRFVDRDMMMRYLGLGIGHMHPVGFPTEVNALRFSREQGKPIAGTQATVEGQDGEQLDDEGDEGDEDQGDGLVQYEY
ncbi:hypothetical protein HWV62_19325 [Athelia sp. TMB]|nr:hypothetical protein HWV62_19325 [Athelia sp. TMB]